MATPKQLSSIVVALAISVIVITMAESATAQSYHAYMQNGTLTGGSSWNGLCDDISCGSPSSNCFYDPNTLTTLVITPPTGGTDCTIHFTGYDRPTTLRAVVWDVSTAIRHLYVSVEASLALDLITIKTASPVTFYRSNTALQDYELSKGPITFTMISSAGPTLTFEALTLRQFTAKAFPYESGSSQVYATPLVVVDRCVIIQPSSALLEIGEQGGSPIIPDIPPYAIIRDSQINLTESTGSLALVANSLPHHMTKVDIISVTTILPMTSFLVAVSVPSTVSISGNSHIVARGGVIISSSMPGLVVKVTDGAVIERGPLPTQPTLRMATLRHSVLVSNAAQLIDVTFAEPGASVRLEDATLTNCDVYISEVHALTVSGNSQIVLDPSLPSWSGSDKLFSLLGWNITFEQDAKLQFSSPKVLAEGSSTNYKFSSVATPRVVTIGSADVAGSCTLDSMQYLTFESGISVTTFCHLSLPHGIVSNAANNISAGVHSVDGSVATLDLSDAVTYETSIDFENFALLNVKISGSVAPMTAAIRGNRTTINVARYYNKPKNIRIDWGSHLPPPVPGVKYLLFDTTAHPPYLLPFDAFSYPTDRYLFEILATPTSPTSTAFQYHFVGENPLAPQIPAPQPPVLEPQVPVSTPTGQPPTAFNCDSSNICTVNSSISQTTLILPPNSELLIDGNLTTNSLVFSGLGSTVTVKGCVFANLSSISVELTEEDLKKLKDKPLTTTLLSIDSSGSDSCSSNVRLDRINVVAKLKAKDSCKRVKVTKKKTDANSKTLSVIFSLDNSKCNLWWIILASVLAGLLVIAIIVVILLAVFVPSFRNKFRPYAKRRRAQTAS